VKRTMMHLDRSDGRHLSTPSGICLSLALLPDLLDVSLVNGYICMKESPQHVLMSKRGKKKERTLFQLSIELSKQFISSHRTRGRKRLALGIGNNELTHMPKFQDKSGRCKACSKTGVRRESKIVCATCNVNLCVRDCFLRWHKDPQNL
jgi:hypothetical protein